MKSDQINELASALAKAQAKIKGMKGPFLAYRFFEIRQIVRGSKCKDLRVTKPAKLIMAQCFRHTKPPISQRCGLDDA